jgi:hypothetical protein
MLVDDIRKGITMRLSVVESVEENTRLYDLESPLKVATTRYTLQTLFYAPIWWCLNLQRVALLPGTFRYDHASMYACKLLK